MTDKRVVGRLIVGKVAGTELDANTRQLLSEGIIGGITLFKDNCRDLAQLIALVEAIRAAGGPETIVAVDQEGGAVQRFDTVLTALPSAMSLGALHDEAVVEKICSISAEQLSILGVNTCLMPVLDVATNPINPIIASRAFSDDPDLVTRLAKAASRAFLRHAVMPVGKHFPGHGDTREDSHLSLAVYHHPVKVLRERELIPFRNCLNDVPAMLTAHIWVPEVNKEPLPTSLSHEMTTGIRRQELGFDKLVMTDDLPVMRAIMDHWGLEEASLKAIQAGNDLLLVSGNADQLRSVHKHLMDATARGTLTPQRLDQSMKRRQQFVCQMKSPPALEKREELLAKAIAAGNETCVEVSARSVSLMRGRVPNLTQGHDWVVLAPNHPRYSLDLLSSLSAEIKHQIRVSERRYTLNPGPEEIEEAATFAANRNCLVLTFRGAINSGQLELVRQVCARTPEHLLIACDAPFEVDLLPECRNAVATCDPSDLAMKGLARALSKQAGYIVGKAPIMRQSVSSASSQ